MFSSEAYGQKNLLFKDSTMELVPIATQTYEAWLGREYLHAMKGLLCDPNRKSPSLLLPAPAQPDCGMAGSLRGLARGGYSPGRPGLQLWPPWELGTSAGLPLGLGGEASLWLLDLGALEGLPAPGGRIQPSGSVLGPLSSVSSASTTSPSSCLCPPRGFSPVSGTAWSTAAIYRWASAL